MIAGMASIQIDCLLRQHLDTARTIANSKLALGSGIVVIAV